MSSPPFFEHTCLERACSRAVDAAGTPCGKEPFLHVAWEDTPEGVEGGWVCTEHAKDLHLWKPLQSHEPGPDCGMPGSRWFFEDNECRCEDVSGAGPENRAVVGVAAAPETNPAALELKETE